MERVGIGHPGRLVRGDDAFLDGLGFEALGIHAAAVVEDFDLHATGEVCCREANGSAGFFALGDTVRRRLNAVVHAVANEVGQGIGKTLEERAVELHIITENLELDFLFQPVAQVADDACEFPEKPADRLQAGAHDRVLQVRGHGADLLDHGLHLGVASGGFRAAGDAEQAVAAENHLAGEIHEGIEQADIDANSLLGLAPRRWHWLRIDRGRRGA